MFVICVSGTHTLPAVKAGSSSHLFHFCIQPKSPNSLEFYLLNVSCMRQISSFPFLPHWLPVRHVSSCLDFARLSLLTGMTFLLRHVSFRFSAQVTSTRKPFWDLPDEASFSNYRFIYIFNYTLSYNCVPFIALTSQTILHCFVLYFIRVQVS